jgi:hypothetical protein
MSRDPVDSLPNLFCALNSIDAQIRQFFHGDDSQAVYRINLNIRLCVNLCDPETMFVSTGRTILMHYVPFRIVDLEPEAVRGFGVVAAEKGREPTARFPLRNPHPRARELSSGFLRKRGLEE